ncbi:MAG: hypothetical protein NTU53_12540 [Planctomycetota bacterium]|nr:hypothetical protein [Planctomycetota bacterium]
MSVSSPVWLLGLVPWAAAVLLLLLGRLKRVRVPFLQLWQGPHAKPRQRRAIEPPPLWLALAMLAMLLSVLAAARPVVRLSEAVGTAIVVIVDRGLTMSAQGQTHLRFQEAIDMASATITQATGHGDVDLLSTPPTQPLWGDSSDWPGIAKAMAPTAADTRQLLRELIRQRLAETRRPVIVFSDQPLGIQDDRLIQIAPTTQPRNVGIVRFGARETPAVQVMVRLRNQSPATKAVLRLLSDDQERLRSGVELPATGERDYFFDVPTLGRAIRVELDVDDDLPADNRAFLVREEAWPIIEPRVAMPPELGRMIGLYSRLRPAAEGSRHVAIVGRSDALPTNDPAAVLAEGSEALPTSRPVQQVRAIDHAVTRSISDWPAAMVAELPSDPTWTAVVSAGGRVLVAVRETPVRQVWVGFSAPQWPSMPDFVIFWTNVFNWLGQGSEAFAAHPIGALPNGWRRVQPADAPAGVQAGLWPGVYGNSDGAMRAVNAEQVQINAPPQTDWRQALHRIGGDRDDGRRAYPLAAALILAAMAIIAVSALTWRRSFIWSIQPRLDDAGSSAV